MSMMYISHDPATALLGLYPRRMSAQRHQGTRTTMLIKVLFMEAPNKNNPNGQPKKNR